MEISKTLEGDDFYHEAADPYESGYIKQETIDICLKNHEIVERLQKRLKDLDSGNDDNHFWVFVEGGATTANDDFRKELEKILGITNHNGN